MVSESLSSASVSATCAIEERRAEEFFFGTTRIPSAESIPELRTVVADSCFDKIRCSSKLGEADMEGGRSSLHLIASSAFDLSQSAPSLQALESLYPRSPSDVASETIVNRAADDSIFR
jgi:hypothetical protein